MPPTTLHCLTTEGVRSGAPPLCVAFLPRVSLLLAAAGPQHVTVAGSQPAELASTDRLGVAMRCGFSWHGSYSVLLSDVDVVWMRDPSHFLAAPGLRSADIAVTSDCIFDFMRPDQQVDDAYGIHAASLDGGAKRPQLLAAHLFE